MLRLKQKATDEDYPGELCAAARCVEPAAIIDRTGRLCAGPLPLCDYHWQVRCALDDQLPPGAVPHHSRRAIDPGRAAAAAEAKATVTAAASRQLRLPFARR